MITTIVLVRAEPKMIPACAKHLAGITGVTDVYDSSPAIGSKKNDFILTSGIAIKFHYRASLHSLKFSC